MQPLPSHLCPTFPSTPAHCPLFQNLPCLFISQISDIHCARVLALWLISLPLFCPWPEKDRCHGGAVGRWGAEGAAGHALHHRLLPRRGAAFHSRSGKLNLLQSGSSWTWLESRWCSHRDLRADVVLVLCSGYWGDRGDDAGLSWHGGGAQPLPIRLLDGLPGCPAGLQQPQLWEEWVSTNEGVKLCYIMIHFLY